MMKKSPSIALHWLVLAWVALSVALLAGTLRWHVPMMLWDHLDLLPLYQDWRHGELRLLDVLTLHDGSHMHAAAYAVLLLTTALSDGQTWLDVLVSWSVLLGYAAIVLCIAWRTLDHQSPPWQWLLLIFLAMYPGHLANLQWGWQVAVFLCLLGSAAAIGWLAADRLTWWRNGAACAAALMAWSSFATALALVPVALVLILLRGEWSWRRRIAMGLPWLLLGVLALMQMRASASALASPTLPALIHYTLNFLGAGVLRFATDLAPWFAVLAMASACHAWFSVSARQQRSAWVGLLLFGAFAALLTALGRAGPFGPEHAFVQRYVSFSSVFWLGWFGLHMQALSGSGKWRRWHITLMVVVALLLVANAAHLIKKAATTGERTRQTAAAIAATYPDVDDALLRSIYFDRPALARARLDTLKQLCFAPFRPSQVACVPVQKKD